MLRGLRTGVDELVCVVIVQGDSKTEMQLEGSKEDDARGSARGKKKWVVDSPSKEENAHDDKDSSHGDDMQEVRNSVCECV